MLEYTGKNEISTMVDRGNRGGVAEENHLKRRLKGVTGGDGGSRHSGGGGGFVSFCQKFAREWRGTRGWMIAYPGIPASSSLQDASVCVLGG